MNERTLFFIKIYLSHFILERVDVSCVWEMSWRRGQTDILTQLYFFLICGGARGVMVIVTGYGHGGTSSIPGQDWLHFT